MQRAQCRTISRSNKAQILFLAQYMAAHPGFAAGDFRTPQGARRMAEEWEHLASALNELGHARTVEQWKICWRDQKRRARAEGGAHGCLTTITGNNAIAPFRSNTKKLVLSAISTEMAEGKESQEPRESPICFNLKSEPSEEVPLPLPEIEVPLVIPEQRSTRPAPQRYVCSNLSPDSFLSSQQELHQLIQEDNDTKEFKDKHGWNDLDKYSESSIDPPSTPAIKRRKKPTDYQIAIDNDNSDQEEDHLAKLWANKLKTLKPTQKLYAEKAINDILFEAQLENLRYKKDL